MRRVLTNHHLLNRIQAVDDVEWEIRTEESTD